MEFSILNSREGKKFLLNALFFSTENVSVICCMNRVSRGKGDIFPGKDDL